MTGSLPVIWRITLEYDGVGFSGWQRQPGKRSVQETLEIALRSVFGGEPITVLASGRTDTGVHALGQVVSFKALAPRRPEAVRDGLNACLPPDVACLEARQAPADFQAIASAYAKLYRYVLRVGPARSALRRDRCWQIRYALDLEAMQRGLDLLVGRHDFTSFRATGCAARSPVREVLSARIRPVEDEIWVELYGRGFLRHMVRNIVGSLIDIGRGKREPSWFGELLEVKDREKAGRTAPPGGLFLVRVDYGEGREEPAPGDPAPGDPSSED